MMRLNQCLASLFSLSVLFACNENTKPTTAGKIQEKKQDKPKEEEKKVVEKPLIAYHFEKKAVWKQKDTFAGYTHKNILAAINRIDVAHLTRLDSFLVPDKYMDTVSVYMPFPSSSAILQDIKKIIIFSYPTQTFAAYENGNLVLTGPTNMGKKASPTPTGLFFCNWKAKETRSTVDEEWILKWNFNVSNLGGVGFHQYELPGYPASHSCMRMWAEQAMFLYSWAEQWKLNGDKLEAKGTPVIVYGAYPFGKPRPWFVLAGDGKALDINEQMLTEIVQPHKAKILQEQEIRNSLISQSTDTAKVVASK